jgi:hypothetical protein
MNSPFIERALLHLKAAKAALDVVLNALSPSADDVDSVMLAMAAVDEALELLRGEAEEPDIPEA